MKVHFRRGYPSRTATPRQFANSWINVEYADGKPGPTIVSPGQVQLEHETEFRMFRDTLNRSSVGNFWRMWRLNPDGTFTQQNPAPLRRRQSGHRRR